GKGTLLNQLVEMGRVGPGQRIGTSAVDPDDQHAVPLRFSRLAHRRSQVQADHRAESHSDPTAYGISSVCIHLRRPHSSTHGRVNCANLTSGENRSPAALTVRSARSIPTWNG